MSMRNSIKTGLLIVLMMLSIHGLQAASLKMPSAVNPGELFVVNLQPGSADNKVGLQFNATQLQFLGAVQGTPEIQMKSDSEVEIKPEAGKASGGYDLKFLPLIASGSMLLRVIDADGIKEFPVLFAVNNAGGSNSWIILVVALVLAFAGFKIWKYQKSAPEMMSTKSLFMNFEELEKARKQNFPDSDGEDQQPVPPTPAAVAEPKPAARPAAESAGKKTLKHVAVKEKPVEGQLARFTADPEEPAEKQPVIQPEVRVPASDKPAVSPPVVEKVATPVEKPVPPAEKPVAKAAGAADGKKTLKNKAVEVPVLSGRLADAPPVEKPQEKVSVDKPSDQDKRADQDKPVEQKKTAEPEKAAEPVEQAPEKKARPYGQAVTPMPGKSEEDPRTVQVLHEQFEAKKAQEHGDAGAKSSSGLVNPKERLVLAIEGAGKAYEAQGSVIRIGRLSENQICITASEVSRKHVEVTVSKGVVSVCPLTETNTTRLNGRTIKEKQTIKPGDTLSLGGTDFVVVKARAL